MNLTEHAVMEIGYLHLEDKEKEEYLKKFVTEFIHEFGEQGHSNNSAPFAIAWFRKYTEGKTFVDKELKDIIDAPVELKDDDPDTWMNNDIYNLVKKYHDLVNTEEFIVHDIDESWIQNILYRLMDWKPITPLMGTPDEWYDDDYPISREGDIVHYQNKRYSSVFALDKNGKDAYNINGKVFTRNGFSFTNYESRVPVSFPYVVPDKREIVQLEDYVKVDDAPTYFIKTKNFTDEYTIGYLKSTLDTSVSNRLFYKADYCILKGMKDGTYADYITYDEPIYYVRMKSRLREFVLNEANRLRNYDEKFEDVKIYSDKECTKEVKQ